MPSRKRNKNLLAIPQNITPSDVRCLTVFVPDDPEWIALFTGALYRLGQQVWYDRDENHSAKVVADRWLQVYLELMTRMRLGDPCEVNMFDIRIFNGWLQKTFDGVTWINVVRYPPILTAHATTLPAGSDATAELIGTVLELGIPRGDTGAQGIQGVQGEKGDTGDSGAAGADAGNVPVGSTVIWWTASLPYGWLLADGTIYLKTDYPDLATVLGAAFETDATHFRVPDMRDRFPLGKGVNHATIDASGGAENVSLTTPNLPNHVHSIDFIVPMPGRENSAAGTANRFMRASGAGSNNDVNLNVSGISTGGTGNGTAHENMPPYRVGQFMIKALPDADTMNVEFQIDGCTLQWRKDGGAWVTLVDLTECTTNGQTPEFRMTAISATRQAIEWKYTDEPDVPGVWRTAGYVDDGICLCGIEDTPPVDLNPEVNSCDIAHELISQVIYSLNAALNTALEWNQTLVIYDSTRFGLFIHETVPQVQGAGWINLINWANVNLGVIANDETITDLQDAVNQPALKQAIIDLICYELEPTVTMTEPLRTTLADIIDGLDAEYTGASAIAGWLRLTPIPSLEQYMATAALTAGTHDCACNEVVYDWCYTWDFTANDGGWTAASLGNPSGVYGVWSSSGWAHSSITVGAERQRALRLIKSIPGNSVIQRVEVEFEQVMGTITDLNTIIQALNLNFGDNEVEVLASQAPLISPIVWEGEAVNPPTIDLRAFVVHKTDNTIPFSGSILITRVTVNGSGANPFGEDSC